MTEKWEQEQQPWLDGENRLDSEIVKDPDLAEDAYAALELDEALEEAAGNAAGKRRPPRLAWSGGLLAAALALMIILPRFTGEDPESPLRLRGAGNPLAVEGMAPSDTLDTFPRMFRWSAPGHPAGTSFRWELYDAEAHRRAVAVVTDTVLVRDPADTPADSSGTWRWLVVELKPDGTEGATSKASHFTVHPEASR